MTIAGVPVELSTIQISPLNNKDSIKSFQCGEAEIDQWVNKKSYKFSEQNRSRVFCAHANGNMSAIGVYSLSFSQEEGGKLSRIQDQSIWKSGVPLVYLGYLAVTRNLQGNGIGKLLLIDCLKRTYHVSQHVAFYGVGLRSLNKRTTDLYAKFGFGIAKGEEEKETPLMILPIWSLRDLFNT